MGSVRYVGQGRFPRSTKVKRWKGQSPACRPSNRPPAAVTITQQAATARIARVAVRGYARSEPDTACHKAAASSSAAGMPNHHSNQPTSQMTTGSIK